MIHVPYKGGFGPTTDLLSGTLDVVFENVPVVMGQGNSERLRRLAVTGRARSEQFPETPTMIESGVSDYVITSWIGVYGPPGLPDALVKRLSDLLVEATKDPAVQEKLKRIGFNPLGYDTARFNEFFTAERARWKDVVDKANIKVTP